MNAERLLAHYDQIADGPDAIGRLRRFILDLAVRGKLVPQDPKEEPASELLKRIVKEKELLIKAGKIKEAKSLSFAGASDIRQDLPAIWKWVPFGDTINSHVGGGTPSKGNSTYWDGEIPWASVKDVGKTKYLDDTIDHITKEGLANSSSNLVPKGGLIVVTRMGLGKVSINRRELAINQDLRALSLSSLMDIDYCYLFLKTYGFEGTGMTVKGIKVEELLSIPFPLPPLAEQHRIVAKVDELMGLCDHLEAARAEREKLRDRLAASNLARLNAPDPGTFLDDARFVLDTLPSITTRADHLKKLRQTVLNLAVLGRMVPQSDADEPAWHLLKSAPGKSGPALSSEIIPEEIPFGWQAVRLGSITAVGTGVTPSKSEPGFYDAGDIPWINSSATSEDVIRVPKFFVTQRALKECRLKLYPAGSLIVALYGQGKTRGQVAELGIDATVNQACAVIQWLPGLSEIKDFVRLSLQQQYEHMRAEAEGGPQPNLNLAKIKDRVLVIPPLAEQRRIVGRVNEFMAICDHLEASLNETDKTRNRLLDALLAEALAPEICNVSEVTITL